MRVESRAKHDQLADAACDGSRQGILGKSRSCGNEQAQLSSRRIVRRIADSRFGIRSRDAHGQRIFEGMTALQHLVDGAMDSRPKGRTAWLSWLHAPRSVLPYFANTPLPSAFSRMNRIVSKMVSHASRGAKPSSLRALVLSKYQK